MRILSGARLAAVLMTLPLMLATVPAVAEPPARDGHHDGDRSVRFQTFNASLNRTVAGELVADLSTPDDPQAATVAEIIQRTRPDVLLLNEFDFVPERGGRRPVPGQLPRGGPQRRPADPLPLRVHRAVQHRHPERSRPRQQRHPSVVATTRSGSATSPATSAWPSSASTRSTTSTRGPSRSSAGRTCPDAMLPDDPATDAPADWYSPEELEVVRLSSKSHWDLPIRIGHKTVHFLVSHPTPPVFDGARGPQRHPQLRRDPVLGRLRVRPRLHVRRPRAPRRPAPGCALRDRGRPEQRPARRRLGARRDSAADRQPADRGPAADVRRRPGGGRTAGRRERHASSPTRSTTPRTSRTPPRATCAPTTCCRTSG